MYHTYTHSTTINHMFDRNPSSPAFLYEGRIEEKKIKSSFHSHAPCEANSHTPRTLIPPSSWLYACLRPFPWMRAWQQDTALESIYLCYSISLVIYQNYYPQLEGTTPPKRYGSQNLLGISRREISSPLLVPSKPRSPIPAWRMRMEGPDGRTRPERWQQLDLRTWERGRRIWGGPRKLRRDDWSKICGGKGAALFRRSRWTTVGLLRETGRNINNQCRISMHRD